MQKKDLLTLSNYFYDLLHKKKEAVFELPSFLKKLITANELLFLVKENDKFVDIKALKEIKIDKDSILKEAVTKKESVIINNVKNNPLYNPSVDNPLNLDVKHMLVVPVLKESEIVGLIIGYITDKIFHQFIKEDIELLESLNQFFVGAIEVYEAEDTYKVIREVKHDIRNLINGLMSSFEVLKLENNKNFKIRSIIEVAINNARFIVDMLELLTQDNFKVEMEEGNIIHDVLSLNYLFCDKAVRKNIDFYSYINIPPLIKADFRKIRQILLNLVGNAVKFTNKGKVEVEISEKDGNLYIKVSDTGIGIKKENLQSIFKAYVREDDVKEIEGSGLGLSIVKKYVDILGGDIRVSSQKGKGTTFEVEIPIEVIEPLDVKIKRVLLIYENEKLVEYIKNFFEKFGIEVNLSRECKKGNYDLVIDIDKECKNEIFVSVNKEPEFEYKKVYNECMVKSGFLVELFLENKFTEIKKFNGTVFVVDDNKVNSDLLVYILKKIGLNVLYTNSSKDALKILKENKNIDLGIVDIHMPEISGIEIAKNVNNIPLIAFSAMDENECKKYVPQYFKGCLLKPITLDKVVKIISEYV